MACLVGAWGLAFRLTPPWNGRAARVPARILVIRLGLIGDGVLLTPALRLLRDNFPDARIDVLVTPPQRELLSGLRTVDRLLVWDAGDLGEPRLALQPRRWRRALETARAIRAERYDAALSCYGALASAIALASGAPRRIGYAGEALPFTLTRALPGARWDRPWHDAEYNVEVVRALDATGVTPPTELTLPDGAPPAALEGLEPRDGPLVVLHTGAVNGRAKRWPFVHWEELVSRLRADGCRLLFVGADNEDRRFALDVARAGENLVGQTSLAELARVLARADVLVTADSGPMHVANALGTPVVALFGPTDPVIYAPFQPQRAVVLRHPVPCQPCYRLDRVADCPLGHTLCQWGLLPEQVHTAVRDLLGDAADAADAPDAPGAAGAHR
ncbi:MAG TPA: glycosyltransferase family 9 protein [Chloroflexota bacterium]|nr:glycosyltransferase family 9 protein [Chloroflexota bacterium]